MADETLEIFLDAPQVRVSTPVRGVLHQGAYKATQGGYVRGWSTSLGTNNWFDPVGFAGMLKPFCLESAWLTTNSGNYARLTLSDFGLTAGVGGWVAGSSNVNRLVNAAGVGSSVLTSSALAEKNQPMYVSHFVFDPGASDFVLAEYGWGNSGVYSSGVSLRFRVGGVVEVWKAGILGGTYTIGNKGGTRITGFAEYMLIPYGNRELLVYGISEGDGFIHVFDDLDANFSPENTITPAEKFWFYRPSGAVDVEIALLKFPSTGTLFSTGLCLSLGGTTTGQVKTVYKGNVGKGTVTASLVALDGSALGTAESDVQCRVKYEITSATPSTPQIWGGNIYYDSETASTTGTPEDIAERLQDVRLTVAEHPSNDVCSFVIRKPEELETAQIYTQANRPLRVLLGGKRVFEGRTSAPRDNRNSANDEAWKIDYEARTAWKYFEKFRFRDPFALDGKTVTEALEWILKQAGWQLDSLVDIQSTTAKVAASERPTTNEFATLIEVGDTAADWIERIIEAYAANWSFGFCPGNPTVLFKAGDANFWESDSDITLYDSRAAALAAGVAAEDVYSRLFRDYERQVLEVEATEVRVTGYDPVRGRAIQAFRKSDTLEDATTDPAARPTGWTGEGWAYALIDPMLKTQESVNRACELIAGRLMTPRIIHQWNSELIVRPNGLVKWRNGLVTLKSANHGTTETVRVNTFDSTLGVYDLSVNWKDRRTNYTAISGAGAYIGNTGYGTNIAQIQAGISERLQTREVVRGGVKGQWLRTQSPRSVAIV